MSSRPETQALLFSSVDMKAINLVVVGKDGEASTRLITVGVPNASHLSDGDKTRKYTDTATKALLSAIIYI